MAETGYQDSLSCRSSEYLERGLRIKGLGSWQSIYLQFLEMMRPASLLEAGAGSPVFLKSLGAGRRVAVDLGDRFASEFAAGGIEFHDHDLDHDRLDHLGKFEAVVCSDVFEHLIRPAFALQSLSELMDRKSVFFTHVPNEFRLNIIPTMLGRRTSVRFHKGYEEWEDPHFRRFTDIGFDRFLAQQFEHRIRIVDLRYTKPLRAMAKLGVKIPFFLEYGPTYICTNDPMRAREIADMKQDIMRKRASNPR